LKQEFYEVMKLASRTEAMIGRKVEARPKQEGWSFYAPDKFGGAPKNFAHALWRKRDKCLHISTKEQWAIRAGEDKSYDGRKGNAWWGIDAEVYWDMLQDSAASLEKLAAILAKVCEARHH